MDAEWQVAVNGWLTVTDIDSVEFCNRLLDMGIGTVIYTDIERTAWSGAS